MFIFFILGLLLGGVVVVFALQNVSIVTITFFNWEFVGSLALVLVLAVAMGVLITLLLVLPESVSSYFKYRKLKKEHILLEEELRKQKERTVFAHNTSPTPEDLAKIEEGVSQPPTP